MHNHYARRKLSFHQHLTDGWQSVIYHMIPPGELITMPCLVGLVLTHPDSRGRSPKEVSDSVRNMVEHGFIHEVPGVRLEQLVDSLPPHSPDTSSTRPASRARATSRAGTSSLAPTP